ncbi:hypothetical protein [Streptomyces sp. URMC 124]|uniref:hypothetical protein n=1 Tax=Streptomyces sp. URMC 124 TaxID=3423405 RepID=UPI003F1DA183
MTAPTLAQLGLHPVHHAAQVRVTDVTLRDGGYLNGHTWTESQAHAVVRAVAAAGVPRIEVGYAGSAARDGGFPSPELLGALVEAASPATVLMMVKPFSTAPDWDALAACGVGAVRIPVPAARVGETAGLLAGAREAGLETVVNLTRVSSQPLERTVAAAVRAAGLGADALYVADSNGSLTPYAVRELMRALHASVPVPLGFHAHDNLRLAFANTLAALAAGAVHVDASFAGIGKGGGNLVLELLLGALRSVGRDDLAARPLAPLAHVLGAEMAVKRSQEPGAWAAGLLDLDIERATHLFDRPLDEVLAFVETPGAAHPSPAGTSPIPSTPPIPFTPPPVSELT